MSESGNEPRSTAPGIDTEMYRPIESESSKIFQVPTIPVMSTGANDIASGGILGVGEIRLR